MLVSGPTGVGKSTLLGVVTGLVPRFTGGALRGDVRRRHQHPGRPAARARPPHRVRRTGPGRRLRHRHRRGGARLRDGAARAAPETMRRRVEETLDLLGIADLRSPRPAHPVRGRAAAGRHRRGADHAPALLVLDEPTSALDPTAAEEVLATLTRLVARPRGLGPARRAPARAGRAVRRPDGPAERRRRGRRGRRPTCSATPRSSRRSSSSGAARLGAAAAHRARGPAPRRRRGPLASSRPCRRSRTTRSDPHALRRAAAGARVSRSRTAARRGCGDVDISLEVGRGHRTDGPQRLGQVDPAVGAAGRPAASRQPSTWPVGTRPPRARAVARWWDCSRRRLPTCSTSRPSPRSARPPPRRRGPGRPRAARPARARHRRRHPPARPVRGAAARSRPRPGAGRPPPVAAARRADPRARLHRQGGPGGVLRALADEGAPCSSRPTTWSSSRGPTTSSCSPRARSSRRGRCAGCVAESPAFAPQVTKVLGPAGSTSTRSSPHSRREVSA